VCLLQASELLTSLTVTLDLLGSKLVKFAQNNTILISDTGIGLLLNENNYSNQIYII